MKRLFCTVVTDNEGLMESPLIYHTKAESMQHAEDCVRKLVQLDSDPDDLHDRFDMFTFEVTELDIIEA